MAMPRKMKTLSGSRMRFIWDYVRDRQPPAIRWVHLAILCLVLNQFIVSDFMGFGPHDVISRHPIAYYGTWIHICGGLTLIPLTVVFILIELQHHGPAYFFGYLCGHFSQLKNDIRQLSRFKLPEPRAQGLAVVVQGLGMGALMLVLAAGFIWFLAWIGGAPWENTAKEFHKASTALIELYVLGHGGMGVIHLLYQRMNARTESDEVKQD